MVSLIQFANWFVNQRARENGAPAFKLALTIPSTESGSRTLIE